jgi:hypothetical protein
LRVLSVAEAAHSATAVVACERYDAAARFLKWDHHFIAKHGSCCALAGTEDTAIRRAERRLSDEKGKVLMIDDCCRVRPINHHDGRQFALGVSCGSHPDFVVAFENAALRDTWVSMLKVRACVWLFQRTAALAMLVLCFCSYSSTRRGRRFQRQPLQCSWRGRKSRCGFMPYTRLLLTRCDHRHPPSTLISRFGKRRKATPKN